MQTALPILIFHTLDDRSSVISCPPQVFRRGMARLRASGYQALNLLAAVDCLRQGKPFPPRSFVITFDDGYRTVYDEAFPVLQQYSMPATVFLTVGETRAAVPSERLPAREGRPMLSWQEIREMQHWGIDFGAHTLTHPDLTRLALERIEAEIRDSQAIIADMLGARAECFAYPYGRYDQRSHAIAQQHFACAVSDTLSLVTARSDPYALERVDAYYLRSDLLFGLVSTAWFPWYVRARNIPRRIRRAVQSRWRGY